MRLEFSIFTRNTACSNTSNPEILEHNQRESCAQKRRNVKSWIEEKEAWRVIKIRFIEKDCASELWPEFCRFSRLLLNEYKRFHSRQIYCSSFVQWKFNGARNREWIFVDSHYSMAFKNSIICFIWQNGELLKRQRERFWFHQTAVLTASRKLQIFNHDQHLSLDFAWTYFQIERWTTLNTYESFIT